MSAAVRAGYKQTEAGVIPEDWKLVSLGEVAATSSGTTPARDLADRYYRNGTVHWVKTLDLNNSDLADTDEQVTLTAVDETSLRPYPVGTVLVAMYGGFNQIGRTGLLRITAAVNQAITAIQPHAAKLQSEYLLATLNFRVDYWKTVASSSRKDPNITSQDVRAFPIAFPSLPEQRAIATALSDVDALLAKLDALIAKKRDLKVATMQQLLTGQTRLPGFSGEWEVKRLGDVATLRNGYTFRSETYTSLGSYKVITIANVQDGYMVTEGCNAVDRTPSDVQPHQLLKIGDILISMTGNVGRVCRVSEDRCLLNQRVGKLVPTFVSDAFLFALLRQPSFIVAMSGAAKGGAQPNLSAGDIAGYEISIPSETSEQAAIAQVLCDMDTALTALETRREKTRAIKQGMMQELLTGRIRLI